MWPSRWPLPSDRSQERRAIQRRDQISHIFTGEDPSTIKESQKKHVKHQVSNVVFNDELVEKPRVKEYRKQRYLFEERIKSQSGYSDDIKQPKQTEAFKRKIKDSYLNNPMKVYNNEENKKYNEEQRQKFAPRAKAFDKVFGSGNCKRTLGGIKKQHMTNEKQSSDKVTNNSFNITQNAMILNKDQNQQVPYYGRRHFITCNQGAGKAMTYL